MLGCEDVAASFQEAVCRHLVTRTHRALLYTNQFFPDVRHFVSPSFFIQHGENLSNQSSNEIAESIIISEVALFQGCSECENFS